MKRLNHLLAAASVCLTLSGCGGGGNEATSHSADVSRGTAATWEYQDADMYAKVTFNADPTDFGADLLRDELANPDPSSKAFYQMIRDMGGFDAFHKLLAEQDEAKLSATLRLYGISMNNPESTRRELSVEPATESETSGVAKPLAITDCVKFFPIGDRNKAFALPSQFVYIDAQGRPAYAAWHGGPSTTPVAGTRLPCGTTVGTWGVATDIGGHMIPAALGGYGGRANVIPQDRTLNGSAWRSVEYVPTLCRKKFPVQYQFTNSYFSPADVRPAFIQAWVKIDHAFASTVGSTGTRNGPPTAEAVTQLNAFKTMATYYC